VKKRRSINQKSRSSIEGITVLTHDKARSAYIGCAGIRTRDTHECFIRRGAIPESDRGNNADAWKHSELVYTETGCSGLFIITEAEYIAACEGAKDAAWVRQWMMEFGEESIPIPWIDNDAAEKLIIYFYHFFYRHYPCYIYGIHQRFCPHSVSTGYCLCISPHLILNLLASESIPTESMRILADALTKIVASIMLKEWMKSIGIHG
jgi:hypothetical protein